MRRFSLGSPILVILITVGLGLRNAHGSDEPATSQASDRTSRHVNLILSSDSRYDRLLKEHFPQIAASTRYDTIKATSVLVANDTAFPVKALALRWSVIHQDGSGEILYTSVFPEKTGNLLPGRDPALNSAQFELASPFAHVEESLKASFDERQSKGEQTYLNAYADSDKEFSHSSVVDALLVAKQMTVGIDGVVFGNGAFIGADNFGLWEKFTCEHNGAIDEGLFLKTSLAHGEPAQSVLEKDIAIGLSSTDAMGGCLAARGREASRLLQLLQKNGSNRLEEALASLSQGRQISLHRLQRP